MGSKQTNSYEEQKKAIENGEISFDINIYLIGENIKSMYDLMEKTTKEENGSLFSYWNYYFIEGEYENQLKESSKKFIEKQNAFIKNPVKNKFKEVIIFKFKKKESNKIDEIFQLFCSEEDYLCPFIIFLFEEDDYPGGGVEKIVPDEDNYLVSPYKIYTLKFENNDYFFLLTFHHILLRFCSYYNELGDKIIVWPKNHNIPIEYNLIEGEYNSYINIFCLGRTGCGKSTFLNKFFKEKRSKEGGTGKSTTSKIIRFGIDRVPIRFYDIPGFEDKEKIKVVINKLTEKRNEMNNDRDTIHIILYFINYQVKTIFFEMEKNIIETLRVNNKDVKIIFVLTHSINDPYDLVKLEENNPKKKLLLNKIDAIAINVKNLFGNTYSYEKGYFQKGSLLQKNIVFVNFFLDEHSESKVFGYDKIIKALVESISSGITKEDLKNMDLKIQGYRAGESKENEKLNEEIKNYIMKNDILKNSTFFVEKDRAIEEATNLYKSLFTYGKIFTSFCPIIKDFKMGINKYQKTQFKKQLRRIFGFTIKNESFQDVKNDYFQMIKQYIKENEEQKANNDKKNTVEEIRDGYHKSEVNSGYIIANEAAGYASYALLFNPVTFVFGGIGLFGTSYISYNQFKKDCTEYFEQYKNHYEEYKYDSLSDCIETLISSIEYFEKIMKELE